MTRVDEEGGSPLRLTAGVRVGAEARRGRGPELTAGVREHAKA